ncbi:MAG: hypothetical protein HC922_10310 [Leptolyngbyaceae cyanobacterium SM2_3_12]|nr:hypothetical protein [Leptolyngbyaceae cyanobacterium SM2_3_12]
MPSDFLLFAQHGWADDNSSMLALATELAPDATAIVAPSLDYGHDLAAHGSFDRRGRAVSH